MRSEEILGRPVAEFLPRQETNTTPMAYHYAALRAEHAHFEYKQQNRTLDIHVEPLREPSGQITGCIGMGLDITERKENEEQIRHQATHDALTGLANYREFVDTLERELRRAGRRHGSFTRDGFGSKVRRRRIRRGVDQFRPAHAETVAGRIESCLRNDTEEPEISVSIGIGVYPDDGRTARELLEAADQGLYRRKNMSQIRKVTA